VKVALLSFEDSEHHKYSYRLSPEEEWQYIDGNTVTLANLPYGERTLYLRGKNNKGQLATIAMQLVTLRPFYEKSWFWMLAIVGMLLLVFLLIKQVRLRRVSVSNPAPTDQSQPVEPVPAVGNQPGFQY